jgi:8-oxo-dGTP pyrophosphatase MutT (NUDIX family)
MMPSTKLRIGAPEFWLKTRRTGRESDLKPATHARLYHSAVVMYNRREMVGDHFIAGARGLEESGFLWVCSAYLVVDGRVLLVHHRGFDKWVPPGGHVIAGETFSETAERECLEEAGIAVEAISAMQIIHPPDDNAVPQPVPFYVDILRDGFRKPALTQYFYVRCVKSQLSSDAGLSPQLEEVHDARLFAEHEIEQIVTFAQVRSLAKWALHNHPDSAR